MSEIEKIIEQCIGEETPPCQASCPLHIDAKGYVDLIAQGKPDDALSLICETLPFPGILGRICIHPCELKCRRGDKDEPIAIAALKRFAADNGAFPDLAVVPAETRAESVAIIGAGPAGLMAAHDLRKMGYRVTIFEALPHAGGMMRAGIPEWRLPRALLEQEIGLVEKLGAEVRVGTSVGKDVTLKDLQRDFNAVFVAVGAQRSIRMGIPGEESVGVFQGIDFLRAINMGDEVKVGDKVVVVGGGNVAVDAARAARLHEAKSVLIMYRRSRGEMPALESEVEEAEREGIEIRFLAAPTQIVEESGQVRGLECIQMKLGDPDESGRRSPVPLAGSEFTLECDMVIPAIGQSPDLSFAGDDENDLQSGRLLAADPVTLETSLEGVFAGGDAVTGPATVIEALAAGRKAAISIDRYLCGEDLSSGREQEVSQESKLEVSLEEVEPSKRIAMPTLPLDQRSSFTEVDLGYSEAEAKEESGRCLQCECKACVKECEYLKTHCVAPRELATRISDGTLSKSPEIVFSCNLCSLCEKLCPQDLNVGAMCLDLRRQLVEEGVAPLPKHQPVIANQEFVNSDSFFLVLPNPANGETRRFFFPGCNLSAYSPELVQKTYEYLRGKLPGTGIVLGCCGGPVHGIGDQKRFMEANSRVVSQVKAHGASELIAACPHCYHLFDDHAEGLQVTSLYEIMADVGLPSDAKLSSEKVFSLHDSCNTREVGKIQDSVRQVLKELGCSIEEPEFTREMTRCCGMGGMAAYVDLRLVNKTIMRRAQEMPHDVLNYCASCRDAFAMVGKPSRHVLDLIFNPEWESAAKAPPKQGPARQQDQARLRDLLSTEYGDS